jgi:hypothetical protein
MWLIASSFRASSRLRWAAALAAILLAGGVGARAEESRLHPRVQAVLLKKILAYDRTLEGKTARIAVVGHSPSVLVEALKSVGLDASAATLAQVEEADPPYSAVYALPGALSTRLAEACSRVKALSFAGEAGPAEDGIVAVGLGALADGRPEIVIHLARSRAEAHSLSAELLRLSRVIK